MVKIQLNSIFANIFFIPCTSISQKITFFKRELFLESSVDELKEGVTAKLLFITGVVFTVVPNIFVLLPSHFLSILLPISQNKIKISFQTTFFKNYLKNLIVQRLSFLLNQSFLYVELLLHYHQIHHLHY